MLKIRKIAMAGALAFATIVPTLAEAGPVMNNAPLKVEKTDVTKVGCWRCRGWRGGWRGGYRGRYWGGGYRGRYWGPRVYVAPRIVVGPTVVVRRGWNAHARWCANRYVSYNPRTNTFIAYGGYRRVCVSPY